MDEGYSDPDSTLWPIIDNSQEDLIGWINELLSDLPYEDENGVKKIIDTINMILRMYLSNVNRR